MRRRQAAAAPLPAGEGAMKRLFKLDILLPWVALAVLAGCAHRVPTAVVEATPVAHIVPLPGAMETRPGALRIAAAVAVEDAGTAPMARRALDELLATLDIANADTGTPLRLQRVDDAALGEEGYRLVVDDAIHLSARTDAGLLHAVQSLRQLLPASAGPAYRVPRLAITDVPAYRWRGLSLDVARSFLPVDYLERHIDRMALFKLNRLHLHLTDDQGWRIEIKRHPRLPVATVLTIRNARKIRHKLSVSCQPCYGNHLNDFERRTTFFEGTLISDHKIFNTEFIAHADPKIFCNPVINYRLIPAQIIRKKMIT